jgi:hypothetical protein
MKSLQESVDLLSKKTGVPKQQIMELLENEAKTFTYDLRAEVASSALDCIDDEDYCVHVGEGMGTRAEERLFGAVIIACVEWDI